MSTGILPPSLDCVTAVSPLCAPLVDLILARGFVSSRLGFVSSTNALPRDDDLFFFYVLFLLKGIDEFFQVGLRKIETYIHTCSCRTIHAHTSVEIVILLCLS